VEDLSLHVLDVAENSLTAGADRVQIRVTEATTEGILTLEIEDNGRGMDEETVKRAVDPFYTTKPCKRVGLGLAMLSQSAKEAGGELRIDAAPGKGSLIRATFQLSHPDIKPLGSMLESMAVLACGHPQAGFIFEHRRDGVVVSRWHSEAAKAART